ncbi:unnamed protein product [marine sediment metagenome]|uniref:Flagellar assembly factor FliW n=1 Tax=marine sediment metagenome TaxID=412755 RepID=X0WWP9_9ZZZZ
MKVKTTRFGELELDESRIITFAEGILGFPKYRKYVLLDRDKGSPFRWLQSVENEGSAFVLIDPLYIMPEYRIEVSKEDISDLNLSSLDKAVVVCIVNISEGCKSVTANLLGPIIVNPEKMLAKQLILFDSPYSIKQNLITSIQNKNADLEKCSAKGREQGDQGLKF